MIRSEIFIKERLGAGWCGKSLEILNENYIIINIVDKCMDAYSLCFFRLGDAIPAESFAAGANQTGGGVLNYNMQIDTPNGWPSQREKNTSNGIIRQWLHSNLKNVSFFYVFRLFKKIINEE